jgi:hypothetical protein
MYKQTNGQTKRMDIRDSRTDRPDRLTDGTNGRTDKLTDQTDGHSRQMDRQDSEQTDKCAK